MPVGELVRAQPARAEVFDALEIDYCCDGEIALDRVCGQRNLDLMADLELLDLVDCRSARTGEDFLDADLPTLCDEIEREHHEFLRRALPKVRKLAREAVRVHGTKDPRFFRIDEVLKILDKELSTHAATEKKVFFASIRGLEEIPCFVPKCHEELRKAADVLERDHDGVGDALGLLRELTDGFTPPADACDVIAALYGVLWELSQNVRAHVLKENNLLIPRLREMTSGRLA